MSQTKNFKAVVQSGTKGFFIQVKGEVNCGMLTVEPTLKKKSPQGTNPKILLLDVYPASDDENGRFAKAEFKEDIKTEDVYEEVDLIDPDGEIIDRISVQQAHGEPANK
jgi:hypothetical protein